MSATLYISGIKDNISKNGLPENQANEFALRPSLWHVYDIYIVKYYIKKDIPQPF
jgi:hypothetical protein